MSSHLLLLSVLLLIRVSVVHIHLINLLLFLLLVFVSIVTGYHYKLHFYIRGINTIIVSHAALHSLGFASRCNAVAFISLFNLWPLPRSSRHALAEPWPRWESSQGRAPEDLLLPLAAPFQTEC